MRSCCIYLFFFFYALMVPRIYNVVSRSVLLFIVYQGIYRSEIQVGSVSDESGFTGIQKVTFILFQNVKTFFPVARPHLHKIHEDLPNTFGVISTTKPK